MLSILVKFPVHLCLVLINVSSVVRSFDHLHVFHLCPISCPTIISLMISILGYLSPSAPIVLSQIIMCYWCLWFCHSLCLVFSYSSKSLFALWFTSSGPLLGLGYCLAHLDLLVFLDWISVIDPCFTLKLGVLPATIKYLTEFPLTVWSAFWPWPCSSGTWHNLALFSNFYTHIVFHPCTDWPKSS